MWGLAISKDGKRAVTNSHCQKLIVWNLESKTIEKQLEGHTDWVWGIALTSDGNTVLSGSQDKTVRSWDVKSGKNLKVMEGHTDDVTGVGISDNGVGVSGSLDKTVRVWDLGSGKQKHSLAAHKEGVTGVAVSADGKLAVSAGLDKLVFVWDLGKGSKMHQISAHSDVVYTVAIGGGRFASASKDKTVKVFELSSGQQISSFGGHYTDVWGCGISGDGLTVASGGLDKKLRIVDAAKGEQRLICEGHVKPIRGVAVSANGKFAVSQCWELLGGGLRLWDIEKGELVAVLSGPKEVKLSVAKPPPKQVMIEEPMMMAAPPVINAEAEAEAERALARKKKLRQAAEKLAAEKKALDQLNALMKGKSAAEKKKQILAAEEIRKMLLSIRPVIGMTIPAETGKVEKEQFQASMHKRRATLINAGADAEALASAYVSNISHSGVIVREVKKGSPGERAGIMPGEYVMSFATTPISSFDEFQEQLSNKTPGDPCRVELFHEETGVREVMVVLGGAGKTPDEIAKLREQLVPLGIATDVVMDRECKMSAEAKKYLTEASK